MIRSCQMIKVILPILCLFFSSSSLSAKGLDEQSRNYDQKHLEVEALIDLERGGLVARSTLKLTLLESAGYLRFHGENLSLLGIHLLVEKGRQKLSFDYDDKIITVYLPRKYRPGETISLKFFYSARPKRGLYFFRPLPRAKNIPYQVWSQGEARDNRHWIPCYDLPDDRLTSELIIYAPRGFQVISNGTQKERKRVSKSKYKSLWKHLPEIKERKFEKFDRWHFHQTRAHVSYLVSLIVGKFDKVEDKYKEIPLAYYVPPGWGKWARLDFGKTPAMMKFLSQYTGEPYPWVKYDQTAVWNFIYGGMENTGATTLNSYTLHDKRAHLDYQSDGLVAHELIHQWFGNLITCRTFSHIWLNEGFATYFTYLWFEKDRGRQAFQLKLRGNNRYYLSRTRNEKWGKFKRKAKEPIDLNFGRRAYWRGAAILHMLRFILGDKTFRRAIGHYLKVYRDQSVVSEDLRRAFEEASGRDLTWFFDQWVYGAGFPAFKVDYKWDHDSKTAQMRIRQTQKETPGRGIFQVPVLVEFKGPGYRLSRRVFLTGRKKVLRYKLPSPPRMVRFNKGGWICGTVDFEKSFTLWKHQALSDDDGAGRMDAVYALRDFDKRALPVLKKVLAGEKMAEIRAEALRSLGQIKTRTTYDLARKALEDSSSLVRREAVKTLALFPKYKEKSRPLLLEHLEKDPSYYVQAEVCTALGKLKVKGARKILEKAASLPSYRNRIQQRVFEALAKIGDARSVPLLYSHTKYKGASGGLHRHRQAALRALVKVDKEKKLAEKAVVKYLEDPHFRMRATAAKMAGQMKLRKAIPLLKKLRKDRHWRPRGAARRALRIMEVPPKPAQKKKRLAAKAKRMKKKLASLKKKSQVEKIRWQLEQKKGKIRKLKKRLSQVKRYLQAAVTASEKEGWRKRRDDLQERIKKLEWRRLALEKDMLEIKFKALKKELKEKK